MNDKSKDKKEKTEDARSIREKIIDEGKFFAGLLVFVLLFQTLIFGHFKIPSESMQPTLEVGDHIYVSKFAYGYSKFSIPLIGHKLPLGDSVTLGRTPKRGDVVVFRNPRSGIIMIKRVFGLPGDEINVRDGRYFLNGQMIDRQHLQNFDYREHRGRVVNVDLYTEQWPGEKQPHMIFEQSDRAPLDNVGPFIVPRDMLFVMGDNRDNSLDSRSDRGPGLVPLSHLLGRADMMVFSFNRCKKEEGLRCPSRRFMKSL